MLLRDKWGTPVCYTIATRQQLSRLALKLTDYLKPEYIEVGLKGNSKEDLLDAMFRLAAKNPHVLDAKKVRAAVLEREKIMSPGGGKTSATPNAKPDAFADVVLAFPVTAEPIDYASMDNE